MRETFERRIVKDVNGFYLEQIRLLPVEKWEGDGWRTVHISSIAPAEWKGEQDEV